MLAEGDKAPNFTLPDQNGGSDGKIAKVFPKVSPKQHDDLVLKALGELAAA